MKRAPVKTAQGKRKKASKTVAGMTAGTTVANVGREFALVRTSKSPKSVLRRGDTARSLLTKTGAALAKPGISHRSVFRDAETGVFAYSVHPLDPSRVVRKSADGTRTVGRVVSGKFKPVE